jgi:hypothetical protein
MLMHTESCRLSNNNQINKMKNRRASVTYCTLHNVDLFHLYRAPTTKRENSVDVARRRRIQESTTSSKQPRRASAARAASLQVRGTCSGPPGWQFDVWAPTSPNFKYRRYSPIDVPNIAFDGEPIIICVCDNPSSH